MKSSRHGFTIFEFQIAKFHCYFLSSKIFQLHNQKRFDLFIFRSVIDSKITNSRYFGIQNWWNHVLSSSVILNNQKFLFLFIKTVLSLSRKMTSVWFIFSKEMILALSFIFCWFFGKPWIVDLVHGYFWM